MAVETGLLNAISNGIVTGSIVALGAIGLALVYDIGDVPNFAHGDLLTLGAYTALLVNRPGTVPGFGTLATDTRGVSIGGLAFLFVVSFVGVLGIVYHLGGIRALKGGWWGIDAPPLVAVGTHVLAAVVVGVLVVTGTPSFLAALLFAVVVVGALVPLMESLVFRKFRAKDASVAMLLIVSLAVAFIVRFGVQTIFGGEIRSYEVDTTIPFAGGQLDITFAKFFDFFVAGNGFSLTIRETRGGNEIPLATFSYSWVEVVAVVAVAAVLAVAAYRWRTDTAGVIGGRLAAALAVVVTVIVGGTALAPGSIPETAWYATRVRASPLRVGIILTALAMMGLLHYLLRATTLGKAMRATSDNRDLAMVRGINTRRVMMTVWIIAGLFGSLAGVLLGFLFSNLSINLGFNLLLPMFAGVILGGINVYGAILGSYVVGLAMEVGIFAIPGLSATYRIPVAFMVLLVVLLVKPEGIVGGN